MIYFPQKTIISSFYTNSHPYDILKRISSSLRLFSNSFFQVQAGPRFGTHRKPKTEISRREAAFCRLVEMGQEILSGLKSCSYGPSEHTHISPGCRSRIFPQHERAYMINRSAVREQEIRRRIDCDLSGDHKCEKRSFRMTEIVTRSSLYCRSRASALAR